MSPLLTRTRQITELDADPRLWLLSESLPTIIFRRVHHVPPMLSVAESVLAADPHSRVTFFYGNRRTGTMMFADEPADLQDLELGHVLSRDAQELLARLGG